VRACAGEDPRLLIGRAAFVDDLKLLGLLHMAVWRSRSRTLPCDGSVWIGPRATWRRRCVRREHVRPAPPSLPVLLTHACLKACPQYAREDRVRCGEGVAVVIAEQRAVPRMRWS
jgi:hypothetical protein